MKLRAFCIALFVAATTAATDNETRFADVGLSTDAKAVLKQHVEAYFRDAQPSDGCVRGEPEPWLSPRARYAFRRVSSTAAAQTIAWRDGSNITVMDSGCEYYTAEIRYVFPVTSRDRGLHAKAAAEALRKLRSAGAKTAFNLAKAERELRRRHDLEALMRSHEEFAVPGDGEDFLQTRVVLQRAGVGPRFGFVEFTLLKGPL